MRFSGAFALLVIGIAILMVGFATRSWELISLLLPITLYLTVASLLRPPPDIRVEGRRELEGDRVMEGDLMEVNLTLTNGGSKFRHLEVDDTLPRGTTLVKGSNRHPVGLPPGGSESFSYTIRFDRRGKTFMGPVEIKWRDPLFLFGERKFLDIKGTVTVMPYVHEIKRSALTPERLKMPVGSARSRLRGLGSEFHSISEYEPGDELKRVNWKASARAGELLINEHESERSGDVTIILDASGEDPTMAGRRAMDLGMEAAVSVSSAVLKSRHRVGLLIVGEYIDTVMPAYGRRQFYRIVDHLLSMTPGEERSIWNTVLALEGRFPFESTLVIISPLTGRGMVESVKMLSGRGHGIAIVSPSPLEIERGSLSHSKEMDMAYRILRSGRDNMVSELRRYCRVYDWNTDDPLEKHLVEVRRSGTGRPTN